MGLTVLNCPKSFIRLVPGVRRDLWQPGFEKAEKQFKLLKRRMSIINV